MFEIDIKQKFFKHHICEDDVANIIVCLVECVELAASTESPVENLKSVGLIFYSNFFLINLRKVAATLMATASYVKRLLNRHQCSAITDMSVITAEAREFAQKKLDWSFRTYGPTSDVQCLKTILTTSGILTDHSTTIISPSMVDGSAAIVKATGNIIGIMNNSDDNRNKECFVAPLRSNLRSLTFVQRKLPDNLPRKMGFAAREDSRIVGVVNGAEAKCSVVDDTIFVMNKNASLKLPPISLPAKDVWPMRAPMKQDINLIRVEI